MSQARGFLEDYAPGQVFGSGRLTVTLDDIRAFAGLFDPQPHHLDAQAAAATRFGDIAASGWHTAALTMRLLVDSGFRPAGGIIGQGVEITWQRPVRPGDTLRLEIEVIDAIPSRLRPAQGTLRLRVTTLNQRDQAVQLMTAALLVPVRGTACPGS